MSDVLQTWPPDNLTLSVRNWLADEVYPGLLGEVFDARAATVWVDGVMGFVALWVSGYGNNLPPLERVEFCKHEIFRRIEKIKRDSEPKPLPPPVAPQPSGRSLVGQVRLLDGGKKGVADDTGPRLITVLHAGDLLAEAFNHGWTKVTAALDYAQSRNFLGVRTWTNLPAPEWWGQPPRPGTFSDSSPGHMDFIRRFARELVARNLRWLVSQGDLLWLYPDKARACAYMARLGQVLQAEGGAERLVLGVDAGNEAWNFTRTSDPVLMGAMLDAFLRECPCALRSMTSARDEGTLNEFDGPPVTVTDKHGSRDYFRQAVERSFTASYWGGNTHPFVIDSEMPGCGPYVSATNRPDQFMEPEVMGTLQVVALMTRQLPVTFSSPGVIIGTEPFDVYDAQLNLGPRIAAMLPPDIQSWQEFHGGLDKPFSPDRVLGVVKDAHHYRCEHVRGPDNRYGVLVYQDEPGSLELPAINGFEGTIMDPGTLQLHPIKFNKGEQVRLDFRRARFLLGRRTT